ncbi:MAG TPA: MarR family winged helix-turn-helix transcriptional regulator [Gaiellaceae bacterium]|nr:MarR family winged helix-turn-helix transcriptional regulator [Gaiellaceae bacterium]
MTATRTTSTAELTGWVTFLRAHAAITRELSAELQREHGLTLHDYEVLLHLARADGGMMRRVDLSKSVLLSASGITRLLEGLERAGLVEKATCQSDGRVSYAKLTETGHDRLREAAATHVRGVEALFASRYSASELETLAQLLSRLPLAGSASTDCGE